MGCGRRADYATAAAVVDAAQDIDTGIEKCTGMRNILGHSIVVSRFD